MPVSGPAPATTIAIVGGGPRGLVVLGRILARLVAHGTAGPPGRLAIHLIDPYENGRIWRTDLPESLLMNSRVGDVTLFSDDGMPDLPGVVGGMDFATWLREQSDANETEPSAYAARRTFARHLAWARRHLLSPGTPGVRVVSRQAQVTRLTAIGNGRRRLCLRAASGDVESLDADAVVLATGHQEVVDDTTVQRKGLARRAGRFYAPPHIVGEIDLSRIEPGRRVAVLGTGLNFFDLVSLLTQGRGGRFVRDEANILRYRPGGREPRLFVGSRRGIPHLSRAVRPEPAHPRFFDGRALQRLAERPGLRDFRQEIWPLIARDLALAHAEALSATPHGGGPLDLERVLDPLASHGVPVPFDTESDLTDWMIGFLSADIRDSRCRPRGPMRAAGEMLAATAQGVKALVADGRIDGRSYQRDVVGWFNAMVAHLASGPPVLRFEQLAALARCGIVRFVGSRVRLVGERDGTHVSCPNLHTAPDVDGVIEARLFATDVRRSADPLMADLVRSGRARPFQMPAGNSGASGTGVDTGSLDVTRDELCLVGADGSVDRQVFAFGVPLEGVHWLTAALPVPRREDLTLRCADQIACAVLRRLWPGS
ncbi:FAD/NAD(P)-binding protein [Solwaraspora sp. WMMB335]|uniref:FAD/NAD(P)-binding protein n=1 Tax=Solwaraspora sp. WMMB335 TaxID=3404118 RepID=UPI003B94D668